MAVNCFLFIGACFLLLINFAELSIQEMDGINNGILGNGEHGLEAQMMGKNIQESEDEIVDGFPREKRQLQGDVKELNANDPKYMILAEESMEKYLQISSIAIPHRVVSIDRVTYQHVAGDLTRIYFKISPAVGTGGILKCISKVWEQAWAHKRDIDVTCEIDDGSQRFKRKVSGGVEEKNPYDPEYIRLAYESMAIFFHREGITVPYTLAEINRVTHQIVAGELTTLFFKITPLTESGYPLKCVSKVLAQPWLKKREIDVDCMY